MKGIASAGHQQHLQAQRDSRNMKILTFIGILYLPASLVAVRPLLLHGILSKLSNTFKDSF